MYMRCCYVASLSTYVPDRRGCGVQPDLKSVRCLHAFIVQRACCLQLKAQQDHKQRDRSACTILQLYCTQHTKQTTAAGAPLLTAGTGPRTRGGARGGSRAAAPHHNPPPPPSTCRPRAPTAGPARDKGSGQRRLCHVTLLGRSMMTGGRAAPHASPPHAQALPRRPALPAQDTCTKMSMLLSIKYMLHSPWSL